MNIRVLLAVCVCSAIAAPAAHAGTITDTFTVDAQVNAACTVVTASSLNFGDYTASNLLGDDVDATMTVETTCTAGSSFVVHMDDGLFPVDFGCPLVPTRRMGSLIEGGGGWDGVDELPYAIYLDSNRSFPLGCNENNGVFMSGAGSTVLTYYGRIPGGAQVAPAQYRDIVTVSIDF